jgi:hypothetical protein
MANPFNEIRRAAELIMQTGAVYELRIPKAGREKTISGYFDDPTKLAECAAGLDATGNYGGIYITLIPATRPCWLGAAIGCGHLPRSRPRITIS